MVPVHSCSCHDSHHAVFIARFYVLHFHSSSNVIVSPQDIAIPVSSVTNGTDGRPVLSFYAQLSADTVVSSSVLMMAVEVCVNTIHYYIFCFTLSYI